MNTFFRFLSVVTVLALMSAPALRAQDDQPYDPPSDSQVTQPAPDSDYDQAPANQQADVNSDYDDSTTAPRSDSAPRSEVDPPARAARLQYMTGSVSVQPQGGGDWISGELNRPLTNSDNIWADKNSRAEIGIGTGLFMRPFSCCRRTTRKLRPFDGGPAPVHRR